MSRPPALKSRGACLVCSPNKVIRFGHHKLGIRFFNSRGEYLATSDGFEEHRHNLPQTPKGKELRNAGLPHPMSSHKVKRRPRNRPTSPRRHARLEGKQKSVWDQIGRPHSSTSWSLQRQGHLPKKTGRPLPTTRRLPRPGRVHCKAYALAFSDVKASAVGHKKGVAPKSSPRGYSRDKQNLNGHLPPKMDRWSAPNRINAVFQPCQRPDNREIFAEQTSLTGETAGLRSADRDRTRGRKSPFIQENASW